MILVDTSIWIDHFRSGNQALIELLNEGGVICHPFVVGELSCGNIKNRKEILSLLLRLPVVSKAGDQEVISFIEKYQLYGSRLGLVDMHLLSSCLISNVNIWTYDKTLARIAGQLKVGVNID